MQAIFRAVYLLGVALCPAVAVLVTVSQFIAVERPQSLNYLGASIEVSAMFLALAILLFGIQRHGGGVARITAARQDETDANLEPHLVGLLIHVGVAGLLLDVLPATLTCVILMRIDRGFAVFG